MAGELAAALFAATLAGAAGSAAELPPEALVRALREARILGELGQDQAQVDALESAARDYPNDVLPLLALLEHHLDRRLAPEAIAEVRSRLAARLSDPATALSLAAVRRIAMDPKTHADDLATLARSLEARATGESVDARVLEALLVVHQARNDIAGARGALERLLAMNRTRERITKGIDLAVDAGDWPAATAFARELLAEKPDDAATRWALAEFLAHQGNMEALEIAGNFARDPKLATHSGSVALDLAWALRDLGKDSEAETAFRRAVAWLPESPVARAALLYLYAGREEQDAQEAALEEGWAKSTDPFALLTEGAHRLAAGDARSAAQLLARAAQLAPDDDITWYNLALAQIKLERWLDAESSLRRSVALRADRPEAWLQLGRVLQKLGRCPDAIAPLETALRLRPDLPQVHFYLYGCHKEMGNAEQAERHLRLHREQTGAK